MSQLIKSIVTIMMCLSCIISNLSFIEAETISGKCGSNVRYVLDTSTGIMNISGTGPMSDYGYASYAPWWDYKDLITEIVIGEGVTTIGEHTIVGCSNLKKITTPDSVTTIGETAIAECNSLTSVYISDKISFIGNRAFTSCNGLVLIEVNPNNSVYDSRENCNAIIETATNTMIAGCKNTIIPDGITSIMYAFDGCDELMTITIPDSVITIGDYAFRQCHGLTSIEIPDSVTNIGNYAFEACFGLTSIEIPDSVTSIGYRAFRNCTGLVSLTMSKNVGQIGYNAFDGCETLKFIELPETLTAIERGTFNNCVNLTLFVPNSVTSIEGTPLRNIKELIIYCDNQTHFDIINGPKKITYTHYVVEGNVAESTCVSFGSITGNCSVCGEHNVVHMLPINLDNHLWEESVDFNWSIDNSSVTATVKCVYDANHVLTETAASALIVLLAPTCTSEGIYQYTATFNNQEFEPQFKIIDIDPFGHDYEIVQWNWNGYDSATASFICQNDNGHTRTEEAVITSEITVPTTCEEAGLKTYTATIELDGTTYTDTKEEVLPETGHDYQFDRFEWDEEYNAKAVYVCSHNDSHILEYEAVITTEITVWATCEIDGIKTYTATYDNESGSKEETLPAFGHDYGEPTYTWAEDNSTVTARAVCNNDPLHVLTETVNTTSVTTATCTEPGITTYTTEFSNQLFTTQTKEIEAEPLGHDYYVYQWRWNGYESAAAVLVCEHDISHTVVQNGVISVTKDEPTCEEDGSISYTASVEYNNQLFSETKKEIITHLNHNWSEWVFDGKDAKTHTRVCINNTDHRETAPCQFDEGVFSDDTIIYTCQECGGVYSEEVGPTSGIAYAVLTDEGDLIFFRSFEVYEEESETTVTDINNMQFTGVVFVDFGSHRWSWGGSNYKLKIKKVYVANNTIIPLSSTSEMFYECKNLQSFVGKGFDSSNVTTMEEMFRMCYSLTYADLSSFDTSNVTNMWGVFSDCSSLTNLDLGNFDTKKVTNMQNLFDGCTSLQNVNLSSFNTSIVTNMYGMFRGCSSLTQLDLSNFDTSNVSDMSEMFTDCSALTSLNLCNFDTKKVTNMQGMFRRCTSLSDLSLNSFITSGVTNMYGMFEKCSSLARLDLSSFDTSACTYMPSMFSYCDSLVEITIGKGFIVWLSGGQLPEGYWTNDHEVKSETELYQQYPQNAETWAGTWYKEVYFDDEAHINWAISDDNTQATVTFHRVVDNKEKQFIVDTTMAIDIAPTCTGKGLDRYIGSFDLDDSYQFTTRHGVSEFIHSFDIVTDALGHQMTHHQEISATCSAEGMREYWECTRCNQLYLDEEGKRETTFEELVIAMLDHQVGVPVEENEITATCTESGSYDEVVYCTKCGQEINRTHKTLDKLGHDFGEWKQTKAPTCDEKGTEERECSRCHEKETRDVEALGHKYGAWAYDGEEAKTHTHVCANDLSHIETQNCEFDEGKVEGNATIYTCKVCGGTYKISNVPVITDVIRIAGANRFGTSQDIALMFKQNNNVDKLDAVILANGDNFADALAGSYLAAVKNAPIIITRAGKESEINAYIRSILNKNGTIYVLGGTAAVPESCLNGLTGRGYEIERIAGNNRYLTNLAILDKAGVSGDTLLIATGTNYADSLSASATGLPMLLVKESLSDEQRSFLKKHRGMKLVILGGTNAVNSTVESQLGSYGEVSRLSGANRAGTSLEIAKKFFPEATTAVIAYSHNFPDGLCGGPLANQIKSPLILTRDNDADATASYMKSKGIKTGYVLGGTSVLTDSLVRKLYAMRSSDMIIDFNK